MNSEMEISKANIKKVLEKNFDLDLWTFKIEKCDGRIFIIKSRFEGVNAEIVIGNI